MEKHLRKTSDVLPMLVHDHQMRFYTLLTRLRFEAELDRPLTTLEPFLRCLLFADEAELPTPIEGDTEYKTWFEGAETHRFGPSLRQLNLKSRLLQTRCSWLIDSAAFQSLPASVATPLRERLKTVLGPDGGSPGYESYGRSERKELLRVVLLRLPERDGSPP